MGGDGNNAPPIFKTTDQIYFEIVDCLCGRFQGLSPFEVLNTPTREVFDLYVDCIINDRKEQPTGSKKDQDQWVTSKTATWH